MQHLVLADDRRFEPDGELDDVAHRRLSLEADRATVDERGLRSRVDLPGVIDDDLHPMTGTDDHAASAYRRFGDGQDGGSTGGIKFRGRGHEDHDP